MTLLRGDALHEWFGILFGSLRDAAHRCRRLRAGGSGRSGGGGLDRMEPQDRWIAVRSLGKDGAFRQGRLPSGHIACGVCRCVNSPVAGRHRSERPRAWRPLRRCAARHGVRVYPLVDMRALCRGLPFHRWRQGRDDPGQVDLDRRDGMDGRPTADAKRIGVRRAGPAGRPNRSPLEPMGFNHSCHAVFRHVRDAVDPTPRQFPQQYARSGAV